MTNCGSRSRGLVLLLTAVLAAGCGDDGVSPPPGFLGGTEDNPQIGLVVNSTGKALTLFQLGEPTETREIPFGASAAITPVGLAIRGTSALVPLGDAASVALVDLEELSLTRSFTFPAGNATGVAFVDDNTAIVANLVDDYVGKVTLSQSGDAITETVEVAPAPTAVVASGGRAYVISGNLDEDFVPLGPGIVTVIDPATMTPLDTIESGGTNPTAAAIGPDGLLYVVNTGDFVSDGTVTVIDPATGQAIETHDGFGPGPGGISIDASGLAYVSGFFTGTVVWNTETRTFVRDAANPVCARLENEPGTPCRGAFDATAASDGSVYQTFFGSAQDGLPPYVFVYSPAFELVDSLTAGVGLGTIEIQDFSE
jgi:DNA-binding beta-propeller fold protein YncE